MPQGNGQSSGDGLDTGTGGFPIDTDAPGAAKAYTMDTGSNANKSAPAWSPGNINVSDAPSDVSATTKRTLASYLSRTTLGMSPSSPGPVGNKYPIVNGPSESPVSTKLQDSSGFVPPLTPVQAGQPAFNTGAQPVTDPTPEAQIVFNKGRSTPAIGARDGNDLLFTATNGSQPFPPPRGDINRASLNEPLNTYTTKVLKVNPYGQELKFLTTANALDEKIDVKRQLTLLKNTTSSGVNPMNRGNFYPINVEVDSAGAPKLSVTKITDESGYPAALRSMVNDNQLNFRDLGVGRSNDSTELKILRGRQKPSSGVTTDGNSLLPFAADVLVGAEEYPQPGTVNVTKLSDASPVKTYTDKLTQKNEYKESSSFSPASTASRRSAAALDTTPLSYPARQEDLSEPRKKTLRDYMAKSTAEGRSRNEYPLDSNPSKESSLIDEKGLPVPPFQGLNEKFHVPYSALDSKNSRVEDLRIGKLETTAGFGPGIDGNGLLKDVTKLPEGRSIGANVADGKFNPPLPEKAAEGNLNPNNPAVRYSKTLLVNRFSPDSPHEVTPTAAGYKNSAYAFAKPREYKKGTSVANRDLTFDRLAQVGNALTQRAGLELGSNDPNYNPTGNDTQTSALLPGSVQLGANKVNFSDLTAESVINDLADAGIKDNLLIDPLRESWGSLNNVNDEFSGISAFGMQLLAVALAIGALVAIGVFFLAFKWNGTFGEEKETRDEIGRLPFGAYTYDPSAAVDPNNIISLITNPKKLNLWRLLGINNTRNDLDKCVGTGALSFFGVTDTNTSTAGAAVVAGLKAAIPVSSSPGYYAVAARNVTRSFLMISDYFKQLGNAFGAGLVAGLKQLFALLEVFRNSKFFKMLNIFAQLGDSILFESSQEDRGSDGKSRGLSLRHKTRIDSADNYAYGKGRIDTSESSLSLTHAWSSYMAPDFLMTNKFFGIASHDIKPPSITNNFSPGLFREDGGTKTIPGLSTLDLQSGRISDDDRILIEDELESQYVPFYFHDVRTNEIVSFHAFLASLTDDYSVSYDSIDAFGRVEPVKIYKSTTRKIGLSFYVAALNQNDFDSMWTKINKLLTMIYPQFDAGQQITAGQNYKFRVPFSQKMKAPPFVRLRVGDLITSNYSKFNLARIFGYDAKGTQFVSGSSPVTAAGVSAEKIDAARSELINSYKKEKGRKFSLEPNLIPDNFTVEGKIFSVAGQKDKLEIEIFEIKNNTNEIVGKVVSDTVAGLKGKLITIKEVALKEFKGKISTDELNRRIYGSKGSDFLSYIAGTAEFLNEKNNSVAKSFKSSGGRGLAGVIESMNFDWYDRVTWETSEAVANTKTGSTEYNDGVGRKAPKMCKITISFSPIHDISPGLDNNGINRAPVYNVRQIGKPSRW